MATATARTRYRPRVAPRSAGSRVSGLRWDRIGRVALVLVLFVVLASYVSPTLNVFETWRESNSASARLGELKAENAGLERQAEALKQPAAETVEARKLGLVAPGEQAYVVDGLK
jgi:cell division protein FtsB